MKNFIICHKCEALLIIDELEIHECTPNYRFEGDYLYTRRKGHWRKIYLPALGIHQPKFNTDNDQPSTKQNRKT